MRDIKVGMGERKNEFMNNIDFLKMTYCVFPVFPFPLVIIIIIIILQFCIALFYILKVALTF